MDAQNYKFNWLAVKSYFETLDNYKAIYDGYLFRIKTESHGSFNGKLVARSITNNPGLFTFMVFVSHPNMDRIAYIKELNNNAMVILKSMYDMDVRVKKSVLFIAYDTGKSLEAFEEISKWRATEIKDQDDGSVMLYWD